MKVVRFMSDSEKEAYLAGAKLMNVVNHAMMGKKTNSIGFCFAEITPERDADKWFRKLACNTAAEFCVEFDTDDFTEPLIERWAFYADDNDFSKKVLFREWSTISYSIRTHPYRRIGKCPHILEIAHGKKIDFFMEK